MMLPEHFAVDGGDDACVGDVAVVDDGAFAAQVV